MEIPNLKNWKTAFLLSIIIPLSLIATFKLTGIIGDPLAIAETIVLEPIVWKRERPYLFWYIPSPTLKVSHRNDEVAFTEILELSSYDPDWFGNSPAIYVGIRNLTFSVQRGFVHSLQVNFSELYPVSHAIFFYSESNPQNTTVIHYNLVIEKIIDSNRNSHLLVKNTKASLNMISIGKPDRVFIANGSVLYLLQSPYNYTHQIEITSEFIYFNGTTYKKLVQPVQFIFGPDNNNSFDDAEEIGFGTREAYLDGRAEGDPVDYYKVWLEQGQTVIMALAYPREPEQEAMGVEMYVYNPNKQFEACMLYMENVTRQITLNVNHTGWWYIKTTHAAGLLTYILEVLLVTD